MVRVKISEGLRNITPARTHGGMARGRRMIPGLVLAVVCQGTVFAAVSYTPGDWFLRTSGSANPTVVESNGDIQATPTTVGTNLRDYYVSYFNPTPVSLGVGETITLSARVTASAVGFSAAVSHFRMGLFNSATASAGRFTGDALNSNTATGGGSASTGYFASYQTGNIYTQYSRSADGAANASLMGAFGGTTNPQGQNGSWVLANAGLVAGTSFTVSYSIFRTSATQVTISSTLGSFTQADWTISSAGGGVEFDTIFLGNLGTVGQGSALTTNGGSYTIEDITVTVVPEPAHASLAAIAIMTLAARRRRSQTVQ